MKERTAVLSIVCLSAGVGIVAVGNADLIYIGATMLFFAICIAYAAWCERL